LAAWQVLPPRPVRAVGRGGEVIGRERAGHARRERSRRPWDAWPLPPRHGDATGREQSGFARGTRGRCRPDGDAAGRERSGVARGRKRVAGDAHEARLRALPPRRTPAQSVARLAGGCRAAAGIGAADRGGMCIGTSCGMSGRDLMRSARCSGNRGRLCAGSAVGSPGLPVWVAFSIKKKTRSAREATGIGVAVW
jgi:hypothetical protein